MMPSHPEEISQHEGRRPCLWHRLAGILWRVICHAEDKEGKRDQLLQLSSIFLLTLYLKFLIKRM